MKKYLFLTAMLFCAGGLAAYNSGSETAARPQAAQAQPVPAPAPGDDPVRLKASQILAQADAAKKAPQPAPAVKKETPKAAEQDSEEAGVLIDSKSDTESEAQSSAYVAEIGHQEDAAFASSIPASYGPMKGVLNEQGRNILVFENEDGILSFVQISVGKNSVSWKLLARVGRSQD